MRRVGLGMFLHVSVRSQVEGGGVPHDLWYQVLSLRVPWSLIPGHFVGRGSPIRPVSMGLCHSGLLPREQEATQSGLCLGNKPGTSRRRTVLFMIVVTNMVIIKCKYRFYAKRS